jgi:hypothetical protein
MENSSPYGWDLTSWQKWYQEELIDYKTRKRGKTRVTRGMQSNYDGSTHRRYKTIKDSSSSDLPNPEHEAIGRVPWVNSTIRVNILFFPLGGSDPRVIQNKEYKVTIEIYDYYLWHITRLFTTRHLAATHEGLEEPDNILNKHLRTMICSSGLLIARGQYINMTSSYG